MMPRLQRKAGGAGEAAAAGEHASGRGPGRTTLVEQLMQGAGGGAPVPAPIRARAEQTTGADLSGVRVHTGAGSATSAVSVGARAHTP